ncbi:amino acid ABC transporter permease [Metaclostridioides mangenotii]|uniref:amino acid ABC transporter permease n=1 Tax=Metaclostridioides mangenotii TaxID=1540 RepID=UPI000463F65E|nr:amino acid ABC transporter permease [Clostridioides mangenotii]
MDFSFLGKYYPMFIDGTITTITISFVALFFGVIIGLIVCLAKISKNKLFNILASIYIEVIRGTPIMVQISIVYFGLPQIGIDFPSEFAAAAFTLSVNSGAYVAEILRSGIQAVDKGQTEASRSLGLSYWSTMRYVIVPQAVKNVLPALANEFISLVKESSIISIIGVVELMFVAGMVRNSSFIALEPFLVAAAIYFVLTFTLSRLVGLLEKKMSVSN